MEHRVATALTIAGSDSGGGAGIQADLKTFLDHGVYGMSAVTAITAQNTRGVHGVHPIPASMVVHQIRVVLDDLPVGAVKVGMLANPGLVRAVAEGLEALAPGVPVVVDPVMVAKGGASLLSPDAVQALVEHVLPRATIITPNLPESEVLSRVLAARPDAGGWAGWAADRGVAVLMKGGHGEGAQVTDTLFLPGEGEHRFTHSRISTPNTHGTGCTLSSAVAARLARGEALVPAVEGAIHYVHHLVAAARDFSLGSGHGPLPHGGVERRRD